MHIPEDNMEYNLVYSLSLFVNKNCNIQTKIQGTTTKLTYLSIKTSLNLCNFNIANRINGYITHILTPLFNWDIPGNSTSYIANPDGMHKKIAKYNK